MSHEQPTEEKRFDFAGWAVIFLLYCMPLLLVLGAAFVGFVKFMAWWRVAFGDCSQ